DRIQRFRPAFSPHYWFRLLHAFARHRRSTNSRVDCTAKVQLLVAPYRTDLAHRPSFERNRYEPAPLRQMLQRALVDAMLEYPPNLRDYEQCRSRRVAIRAANRGCLACDRASLPEGILPRSRRVQYRLCRLQQIAWPTVLCRSRCLNARKTRRRLGSLG